MYGAGILRAVTVHAGTHTGLVRSRNEDAFGATGLTRSRVDGEVVGVDHGAGASVLAVVADGLGGHPCGDVASSLVVDTLLAVAPTTADELIVAVHEANQVVVDAMSDADGSVGMGSTVAAVLVSRDGLAAVNIGDSCVFELVGEDLIQLSVDDVPTGLDDEVVMGASVVTQTLGGASRLIEVEPHVYEDDRHADHDDPMPRRLLLCTDGLTNFVALDRIARTLRDHEGAAAIRALIDLALEAGGPDNVTCMTLDA